MTNQCGLNGFEPPLLVYGIGSKCSDEFVHNKDEAKNDDGLFLCFCCCCLFIVCCLLPFGMGCLSWVIFAVCFFAAFLA